MEKGRNSSVGVRKKAESERDEKELNEFGPEAIFETGHNFSPSKPFSEFFIPTKDSNLEISEIFVCNIWLQNYPCNISATENHIFLSKLICLFL